MVARRIVKRPTSVKSASMSQYLKEGRTETRVLGPIGRHLLSRPLDTSRRQDVLHPSEMIKEDWCHRASYHALRGVTVDPERHAMALESVFEEGHEIHRKWQRWLYEMGVLLGNFECRMCKHVFWGQSPTACEKCQSISLVYKEVPAVSDKYRIHGHADGGIRGLGNDLLLEIKSIGPGTIRTYAPHYLAQADGDVQKAWKEIKRPFVDHVKQTQIYMEVLRLMAEENGGGFAPEEVVFIYELKATQASKEFVVRRSTRLVDDILEAALDVVYAAEKGKIPDCNVSPEGCKKCKAYDAAAAA